MLPHEEDMEAGEEGLLVDAEVPGHEVLSVVCGGVVHDSGVLVCDSAPKSSIRRFVITEKAPTRAFSWLKAATTAFTFKTLC